MKLAQSKLASWLVVIVVLFGFPLLTIVCPPYRGWFFAGGLFCNAALFYASVRSNCQWFGRVVTRFKPEGKQVWLTIDDGPHSRDTLKILNLLERYKAKATFFVIGKNIAAHPDLACQILKNGHQLGNHSQTHPGSTFWCSPRRRLAREVDLNVDTIERISGISPQLFRAPVGMANIFLHNVLYERKLYLIGWSARGFDTLNRSTETVVEAIMRSVSPGTIILLHEGKNDSQGNPMSLQVIEALLVRLNAEGYQLIVPDEDRFL